MHLGCTAAACSCAERPHAGCPADRRQASSRSACQNVVQAESWYYWETVKKDEAQGPRPINAFEALTERARLVLPATHRRLSNISNRSI